MAGDRDTAGDRLGGDRAGVHRRRAPRLRVRVAIRLHAGRDRDDAGLFHPRRHRAGAALTPLVYGVAADRLRAGARARSDRRQQRVLTEEIRVS